MARHGLGVYILTKPAAEDAHPEEIDDITDPRYIQMWEEPGRRVVRATRIYPDGHTEDAPIIESAGMWVSTVFLGMDHDHFGRGAPILWETLPKTKGEGWLDRLMRRYSSLDEAKKGHQEVVDFLVMRVRDGLPITEDLDEEG